MTHGQKNIKLNKTMFSHSTKCLKTRQAMLPTYKRNIEARSCNRCCRGKAIITTYSECASVALVTQHAKRMRRVIL
jgi:hypothetical protein